MIDSHRARLTLLVTVMLSTSTARAGVWGIDPSVGVSGDYASDPLLVDLAHTSQTDAALLLDSPVSYQGDALTLSFLPSFRVSDTHSYASLNSDYVHLTGSGELDSDRNTFKMSVAATRDSSLYENFLVDGEEAVRRDALTGDLSWTRHLTERLDADIDVNTSRVRYGESTGNASLVNYNYSTVSPGLSWQGSERDKVTLSLTGGEYDSVDATTRSRSYSAQLAYNRSLSELWSLNLSAGYSRQQDRLKFDIPEIVFIPGYGFVLIEVPVTLESQVDSPVYSVRLDRSGPRWSLSASASRQETPTGFAFLSRQTIYDLQLTYALSERWSVTVQEYWLSEHDPSLQGPYLDRTLNWVKADFTYQLSEHYNLDLALARVDETYSATDLHIGNNQVTLTLTYKFNHISLQ